LADGQDKPKKRPNAAERRALAAATVQKFLNHAGRTARRGGLDPNDRRTDPEVQLRLKRMRPEEVDRLMHDDKE
jgi:hypothetical protein